ADGRQRGGVADQRWMTWVRREVAGDHAARSREDADGPGIRLRAVAGVIERAPGDREKQAMLGIRHRRFARRVPEERGVEAIDAVERRRGLHIARIVEQRGLDAALEQLVVGEAPDGLHALAQVPPER